MIFFCHFPIDISIIITRFVNTIKANIPRTDIEILFVKLSAFHSEGGARTINFFCHNPRILVLKHKRHIFNSLFVCLLHPRRPAILLILLLAKEQEKQLTAPIITHHPTDKRLLEQLLMTRRHLLILIYRRGLTSIIFIICIGYAQLLGKETGFIYRGMNHFTIINFTLNSNMPAEIRGMHKQTLRNSLTHLQSLYLVMPLLKESKTFTVRRDTRVNLKVNCGIANLKLALLNNYTPTANDGVLNTVITFDRLDTVNYYNISELTLLRSVKHYSSLLSYTQRPAAASNHILYFT